MVHFENTELGVSFDLPEKITVGDHLRYKARVHAFGIKTEDVYVQWWHGARGLIHDWQCETMPDINTDIEQAETSDVTDIVLWVATSVAGHMATLGTVEKN